MTLFDRRSILGRLAGVVSFVFAVDHAEAGEQRRRARRGRRRVRRRVRRRIRRRVTFRTVAGRRVWVAPVALAAGWELVLDRDRVVVVEETKFVERNGVKVEVAVVKDADGKKEEIEIARDDTTENRQDLQGTVLPDDDRATPAIEKEEEVEVDD